jgi:hypothetical protein
MRGNDMEIILQPNCSGKTKELIKRSLATNTPILAINAMKKASLEEKGLAYFGMKPWVLSFEEAQCYVGPIMIDDAEKVLTQLLTWQEINVTLDTISMSTEN